MKSVLKSLMVASLFASVGLVSCKSSDESKEEPKAAVVPTATAAPTTAPAAAPASKLEVSNQTVYFDFDSYSLTPAAQDNLRKLASALKSNSAVKIQIEGHCDERGSNEYNLALGERRARAAKDFLVSEGVPADSVSTISFGEEKPAVLGTGEEVWAKNRRDEFKKL